MSCLPRGTTGKIQAGPQESFIQRDGGRAGGHGGRLSISVQPILYGQLVLRVDVDAAPEQAST